VRALDRRVQAVLSIYRRELRSGAVVPAVHPELDVAPLIDHTLLKPESRRLDIERLCREAKRYRFAAVCVNGAWVAFCARRLRGTGVKVAAVVGFPLGAGPTEAKAAETRGLVADGANEIDVVVSIGHVLDGDWAYVGKDLRAVVKAAAGRPVKAILETALLKPGQIVRSALMSQAAGAAFVKTSTGFHPAGNASIQAVRLLRLAVGPSMGVKASGGIRDCETVRKMIAAGADRIGTSSGVKLVTCGAPADR